MIKIKQFIEGSLEANGYVIYHKNGGECFIIDPGYNAKRYIKFISEEALKVKGILLTHYHYDHVGAVQRLKGDYGCPVFLHRQDINRYKGDVDIPLEGGEVLLLDDEKVEVLHTPGHTLGGVCYKLPESKVIFTGDTIFNVDIGRTDFVDSDPYLMLDTMINVVNTWKNDYTLYPGHGESATMKYIRDYNLEFIDAQSNSR